LDADPDFYLMRIQVIKMMRIWIHNITFQFFQRTEISVHLSVFRKHSPGLVSSAVRKVVLYIVKEVIQPPPDLLTQALHFCRLTSSLAHSLVQIHHLSIN
jgi:hypothetical protein